MSKSLRTLRCGFIKSCWISSYLYPEYVLFWKLELQWMQIVLPYIIILIKNNGFNSDPDVLNVFKKNIERKTSKEKHRFFNVLKRKLQSFQQNCTKIKKKKNQYNSNAFISHRIRGFLPAVWIFRLNINPFPKSVL